MSAINVIYICNVSAWLLNYVCIPWWCHWQVSFRIWWNKKRDPSRCPGTFNTLQRIQKLWLYLNYRAVKLPWLATTLHLALTNILTVSRRLVRNWQNRIFLAVSSLWKTTDLSFAGHNFGMLLCQKTKKPWCKRCLHYLMCNAIKICFGKTFELK